MLRGREKMWSIDTCIYSYHLYLSSFLHVLSFSLFFLLFLSTSPSFCFFSFFFFFAPTYPLLYHLPLWDLPFLPLNYFWLLMGVLPRLPTSLPTTQPLSLLWMCWLHHSPFPDKIACLVSYLSLFFTSLFQRRIKPLHYLPLWHASSGPSLYIPLLGEMSSQQDISPKEAWAGTPE